MRRSSTTIVVGGDDEDGQDDLEADDGISDAPLVRLVNSIIFQAAEDGASDIHVEPQEDELIVRYRIDGVLHVAQRVPKRLAAGVTTRLKVLAKLDIAERRKPQDGRITLTRGRRRSHARHPRRDAADGRGRVRDDAPARQVARGADARRDRPRRGDAAADGRRSSRGRPARCSSPARPARASRRRSTPRSRRSAATRSTSSPSRTRSSTGSPRSTRFRSITRAGPHVRHRAAVDPPFRPRRRDGRRDPRRRDRAHLDRGCAHGPLRALDAAHERRAVGAHAPERDGRRAVHHRRRRLRSARAAAGAQALHALRRGVRGRRRRSCSSLHVDEVRAKQLKGSLFYRKRGCPRCGNTGLPRTHRRVPAPRDERAARAARVREGVARRDRRGGACRTACGRCGRTASRRSSPASRPPKSSRASARLDEPISCVIRR